MQTPTFMRHEIETSTLEMNTLPALDASVTITPRQIYDARCERFAGQRDVLTAQWNRIANFRLAAFLAAVLLLGWGFWQDSRLLQLAGLALLVAFFVLVGYHNRLGKQRKRLDGLYRINDEARMRLNRKWADLPLRHAVRAEPLSPYAQDLDIFGRASLFQLIETVGTQMGESTLASWLMRFASVDEIGRRQRAVAELAPLIDFRDSLTLPGRLFGDARPDPNPFLEWAESPRWLALRPWLRWAAIVDIIVMWALLFAQLFGVTDYPLFLIFAAVNLLFSMSQGRTIYDILSKASTREGAFRQYAEMFELLSGATFTSPMLRELQARLLVEGAPAHLHIRRLHRLAGFTIPPSAQLYTVIQAFTLWDVHLLVAFEGWQAHAGRHVREWLAVLGEVEALSALSILAHDNPDWAFPRVASEATWLDAQALGHPLIAGDARVSNDVQVGPTGTFLLVTGSNMSGKSTLLRAIGVNIVLAGAGGPVCARSLRLPPVELWSSMRVADSLEQGVSYFMAELKRLKQVVDAAGNLAGSERRLFYLLDEILHGTNTAERQVAARRVVLYLVSQGALGAVSTHDLSFAKDPQVANEAHLYHFTENFTDGAEGPQMTFSYKLLPGIATSTNALKLMRIVGLDV